MMFVFVYSDLLVGTMSDRKNAHYADQQRLINPRWVHIEHGW